MLTLPSNKQINQGAWAAPPPKTNQPSPADGRTSPPPAQTTKSRIQLRPRSHHRVALSGRQYHRRRGKTFPPPTKPTRKKSIFSPSNQSKIFHRIRHLRTIPPPTTKFSICQARHNRFNFPASPPTSKIVRLVSGKHSSLCGQEFRMPDRSNHNNYEPSQEQSSISKGESAFPRVDNARETKEREGGGINDNNANIVRERHNQGWLPTRSRGSALKRGEKG